MQGEQETLTDGFTREAQLTALAVALKGYKHWHSPHSPNNRAKDPLTDILQVAFRAGLTDPHRLAEATRVNMNDIVRCAEDGIVPDRRDRRQISDKLKKMLALSEFKI